jgi:hypothetical protein
MSDSQALASLSAMQLNARAYMYAEAARAARNIGVRHSLEHLAALYCSLAQKREERQGADDYCFP